MGVSKWVDGLAILLKIIMFRYCKTLFLWLSCSFYGVLSSRSITLEMIEKMGSGFVGDLGATREDHVSEINKLPEKGCKKFLEIKMLEK